MSGGGGVGVETAAAGMLCCASCGKAEVDDIKLKKCACKLVKYCSVECQKNHRSKHKKVCEKRMAKRRDDRLFRQPDESHLGECPLCCLPLPLDPKKYGTFSCCCKRICGGCCYANQKREKEQGLEQRCPFCREKLPTTDEEIDQNFMERAKANDPIALFKTGRKCYKEGDFGGAVEYFSKAAAMGEIEALYNLSIMYQLGKGVEKDEKKKVYHLEEAAIGGHPDARYNLGNHEVRSGRGDRGMKHYIIGAKLGDDGALEMVKENFRRGYVSKENLESALRGHQAAVDATKSAQRDAAEKCHRCGCDCGGRSCHQ